MFVPGKNPVKKPGWKAHKPMLLTYVADRHMAIEFTASWLHTAMQSIWPPAASGDSLAQSPGTARIPTARTGYWTHQIWPV